MRAGTVRAFGAAALLAAGGCATLAPDPAPAAPSLSDRIDGVVSRPPLDGVHWGILLVDPSDGRVLHERNGARRFVPASNMKIPVTAVALDLLGPGYRWETSFHAPARPAEGVLEGNLYLPALGDPSLGEPFFDPPGRALDALADSLRAAGVGEVRGRLVVDVSAWDSTTVPSSWMVGNLDGRSGATGGAFALRAGEVEVRVRGGERSGEPAEVGWEPRGREPFVEGRVVTGEPDGEAELGISFLPESRRWVVEGTIPAGDSAVRVRAARDPVRLGADALAAGLEARGIRIDGGVEILWERDRPVSGGCRSGSIPRCPAMFRLAVLASPPLSEVARAILEPSQNWMTEQLVRTLGAELGEEGSWTEGFRVLAGHLTSEMGADSLGAHFRDGSGLSAYNLLSPRTVVRILDHARGRPWGPAFRAALAEPGKEDTTLASRLEGLEGRVFAKTGTISHVNALSGYLVAEDGRELLFSVLTNASNLPAAEVREAIDEVVRAMARP